LQALSLACFSLECFSLECFSLVCFCNLPEGWQGKGHVAQVCVAAGLRPCSLVHQVTDTMFFIMILCFCVLLLPVAVPPVQSQTPRPVAFQLQTSRQQPLLHPTAAAQTPPPRPSSRARPPSLLLVRHHWMQMPQQLQHPTQTKPCRRPVVPPLRTGPLCTQPHMPAQRCHLTLQVTPQVPPARVLAQVPPTRV
jgi:hypothetical protein